MPLPISATFTTSSLSKFFFLFFFFLLLSHGRITAAQDNNKIMNIGAIIDANSRIGREEKIAMEIGIHKFNNASNNNYKLVLYVSDSGGDPLTAASAADDLIKDKQVQAIIGMETWQEAALVAEVGNRAQVPVISFATAAIAPPLSSVRWPYLARMANNATQQMKCVADIAFSYRWRRVVVIYEDDTYGVDTSIITLLSDTLRRVGSEIEYWFALPPISSLSDPKTAIREELEKVKTKKQSRVFIVHSSIQLATYIFTEAKEMDLMGRDSVWITTDSITSVIDNLNSSVMSSMDGVIGIKTYFSENSPFFRDFSIKFKKEFRSEYQEEDKYEPGVFAMRAYDTISMVTRAMEKLNNISSSSTSRTLLQNILSSDFTGLSGEIRFKDGELSQNPVYKIVNVLKKSYIELKFWSMEFGFSGKEGGEEKVVDGTMEVLGEVVNWPGGLHKRAPRGWLMPSDSNKLKIGVPGRTSFEKFVKVRDGEEPTGFCIDVFKAAVNRLEYDLPHDFIAFPGSYDDLVNKVYVEEFDAVVGDVTILANRSKFVEFTQPYAESGLSMIVPVKPDESQNAWMFLKPFTMTMWLVTGVIFVYTMFVVWFLEHRSNPEFRGPWKNQLGTALWFTFSTLFFAHKEKLRSNFTRIVVVVWLFVVFVVTSSYTASLTSMLTVQQLEPTVTDIDSLKRSNSKVGCDGDSFVRNYLVRVLDFQEHNVINISSQDNYIEAFGNGSIKAAFLELPYLKVFLSIHNKGYKVAGESYRFGGFGFAFRKGSPIAADISQAFLELSESGEINKLEKDLYNNIERSSSDNLKNQSLSLHSFWGLFVITGGTSTIVFLLYLLGLLKKFRREEHRVNSTSWEDNSFWNRTKRLKDYYKNKGRVPTAAQAVDVEDLISTSDEAYVSEYNTPGHPQGSSPAELIEMTDTYVGRLGTHAPVLSLASLPRWDRHFHASSPLDDPERQQPPHST